MNIQRTILSQADLAARKVSSIILAFTLTGSAVLSGCDPGMEPKEIADLGQYKPAKLVQGRDNCIKEMMQGGDWSSDDTTSRPLTREEAEKLCDEAMLVASTENNATEENKSGHYNHVSRPNYWYMIHDRNKPVIYTGTAEDLTYYGGAGSTTSRPPMRLSPAQSEYLSSAHESRYLVSSRLAKSGAPMVPSRGPTTPIGRGGMSAGRGVSMGG